MWLIIGGRGSKLPQRVLFRLQSSFLGLINVLFAQCASHKEMAPTRVKGEAYQQFFCTVCYYLAK